MSLDLYTEKSLEIIIVFSLLKVSIFELQQTSIVFFIIELSWLDNPA